MLKNELIAVSDLFVQLTNESPPAGIPAKVDTNCYDPRLEDLLAKVRQAWASASFSDVEESALTRYFSFQFKNLAQLMDIRTEAGLVCGCYLGKLTHLMEHLTLYFGDFLRSELIVPPIFARHYLNKLENKKDRLLYFFQRSAIQQPLKDILTSYLENVFPTTNCTNAAYGALIYLAAFIGELLPLIENIALSTAALEAEVTHRLLGLNFNDLRFLSFLQEKVRRTTADLRMESQAGELRKYCASFKPNASGKLAYDPSWPPVTDMLKAWIAEELAVIYATIAADQTRAGAIQAPKLSLDLSVAHLACLTRLLFEAGAYASGNLTEILSLTALHFSTRRQNNISQGSLGKEYYSVSQKTAAIILELLQKMTINLKKSYFPV